MAKRITTERVYEAAYKLMRKRGRWNHKDICDWTILCELGEGVTKENVVLHLRKLVKQGRLVKLPKEKYRYARTLYRLPETPAEIAKLRLGGYI